MCATGATPPARAGRVTAVRRAPFREPPGAGPRIRLRTTTAIDLPALAGVLVSNAAELPLTGVGTPRVDAHACADLLAMEATREHARCLTIIERATGRAVGLAVLLVPNPADEVPWISLLVIAADVQNRGLGTETAHRLERFLENQGWREVRLGVIAANAGALRFWQRLGYRELPGAWRSYNGMPHRMVTLARDLRAGAPRRAGEVAGLATGGPWSPDGETRGRVSTSRRAGRPVRA